MRENRRLRVFENRVLRIILGPKRDEETREWRELHNVEINGLYCLGDKIENNFCAGHVARMGEKSGVYRVLAGKPEGKRTFGRPRRRWGRLYYNGSSESGM
jgi:hypothetical protein